MINDTQQPEWRELRGMIKNKFGKLSAPQIDGLNGHMERLEATVQRVYHYDKERAASECKEFNDSIKRDPNEAERTIM